MSCSPVISDAEARAWLEAKKFRPESPQCVRPSHRNSLNAERPTAVLVAAEEGNLPVLRWLFANGCADQVSRPSNHKWTPLARAASRGHVQVAQFLLDRGVRPRDLVQEGEGGYTR